MSKTTEAVNKIFSDAKERAANGSGEADEILIVNAQIAVTGLEKGIKNFKAMRSGFKVMHNVISEAENAFRNDPSEHNRKNLVGALDVRAEMLAEFPREDFLASLFSTGVNPHYIAEGLMNVMKSIEAAMAGKPCGCAKCASKTEPVVGKSDEASKDPLLDDMPEELRNIINSLRTDGNEVRIIKIDPNKIKK